MEDEAGQYLAPRARSANDAVSPAQSQNLTVVATAISPSTMKPSRARSKKGKGGTAGADAGSKAPSIVTAQFLQQLMAAVSEHNVDAMSDLLKAAKGIDIVNMVVDKSSGTRLVHAVSENGGASLMRFVLDAGGNVEITDHRGHTPLSRAAVKGNVATMEVLLAGPKVADLASTDKHDRTALHLAAQEGQTAAVRYLIEKGASLTITDMYDNCAIACADNRLKQIEKDEKAPQQTQGKRPSKQSLLDTMWELAQGPKVPLVDVFGNVRSKCARMHLIGKLGIDRLLIEMRKESADNTVMETLLSAVRDYVTTAGQEKTSGKPRHSKQKCVVRLSRDYYLWVLDYVLSEDTPSHLVKSWMRILRMSSSQTHGAETLDRLLRLIQRYGMMLLYNIEWEVGSRSKFPVLIDLYTTLLQIGKENGHGIVRSRHQCVLHEFWAQVENCLALIKNKTTVDAVDRFAQLIKGYYAWCQFFDRCRQREALILLKNAKSLEETVNAQRANADFLAGGAGARSLLWSVLFDTHADVTAGDLSSSSGDGGPLLSIEAAQSAIELAGNEERRVFGAAMSFLDKARGVLGPCSREHAEFLSCLEKFWSGTFTAMQATKGVTQLLAHSQPELLRLFVDFLPREAASHAVSVASGLGVAVMSRQQQKLLQQQLTKQQQQQQQQQQATPDRDSQTSDDFVDFARRFSGAIRVFVDNEAEFLSNAEFLLSVEGVVSTEQKILWIVWEIQRSGSAEFELNISRDNALEFAMQQIVSARPHQLQHDIEINFAEEEGVGSGPTKEFFTIIMKALFGPDSRFFSPTPDGTTFVIRRPEPPKPAPRVSIPGDASSVDMTNGIDSGAGASALGAKGKGKLEHADEQSQGQDNTQPQAKDEASAARRQGRRRRGGKGRAHAADHADSREEASGAGPSSAQADQSPVLVSASVEGGAVDSAADASSSVEVTLQPASEEAVSTGSTAPADVPGPAHPNPRLGPRYPAPTQSQPRKGGRGRSKGGKDTTHVQSSHHAAVDEEMVQYMTMAGRVIGMAVVHEIPIGVKFPAAYLKHLLDQRVTWEDCASIDSSFFTGIKAVLEMRPVAEGLTFVVSDSRGNELELRANGSEIEVTDENKEEFVSLAGLDKIFGGVRPLLKALRDGFWDVIPRRFLRYLSVAELNELLAGPATVDVAEWRSAVDYVDIDEDADQVEWFWKYVAGLDDDMKRALLMFWSSCESPPVHGFGRAREDEDRWMLELINVGSEMLPTSNTCYLTLKMPAYPSYDVLKQRFDAALKHGSVGYAFR